MPFQLKIKSFGYTRHQCTVAGELISGAYFGPENVEVELTDGTLFTTSIGSMGADNPKGWPMLPEHNSTLRLELIDVPPVGIHVGGCLRGIGTSSGASTNKVSTNSLLADPVFWASHYFLLLGDEFHDASDQCRIATGISPDQVDEFYRQHCIGTESGLPSPLLRVHIDPHRYVEVEYAEAAEPQVRYKIGDVNGAITLGYDSGHFSLPAMRWQELEALSAAIEDPIDSARASLLLFPGIYLSNPELERCSLSLMAALDRLGLFQSADKEILVSTVVKNRLIDVTWERHQEFGWITNGPYAQRNPDGLLSSLTKNEFLRIAKFFGY